MSKDEAPTPLSVVGPLFISSLLFHLSRALLRAWRFSLFVLCTQLSQQAGPHLGTCLLLGVLFSQFILVCFIIYKNEKVFVLFQQTSNFVASLGQGLGQGQLPVLAIHCFFSWLALLFLELYRSFRMYELGGQSRCLTRPLILSLCGVVRERLLPCRVVVTAKWVVSCTRITCVQPLSRCSLTLLASSFFLESVVVVFSVFSPPFSPCVLSFLSLVYWPFRIRFLACLIRAAILYFSCRLHLFTSRCFVIGSPDQRFALSVCSLCFSRWKPGQ